MKNVKIKIIGIGYNNIYEALVIIFDKNNNIICKGKTFNGTLNACLKVNRIYKIKVCYLNQVLNRVFYVNNYTDIYEFAFNCSYYVNNDNTSDITLFLTDYFYDNLPIEKGDIILNG